RGNRSNDLETLSAELVARVVCRVPPGEIKIDHIESGNSDPIQRSVIVRHFAVEVAKIVSQFQPLGRRKNISRHFHRRICWQSDVQRTVAYHIEQDAAAKLLTRLGICKLPGKIAASVQTIGLRKMFVGFFAIKEHEFDLGGQIRMLAKNSG